MKKTIILASGSPRRKELLSQIGLDFRSVTSNADETTDKNRPEEMVLELSRKKAEAAASLNAAVRKNAAADFEGGDKYVYIGADTVVYAQDRILGKPADREEAFLMLKSLSGKSHSVFTGVTLLCGTDTISFYEETKVFVYEMTDDEIWAYIDTGEPMDKAGAYGIQGAFAAFVSRIEGDYNSVVGLPVGRLYQEMRKAGYIE